jgi:hypothetical protein
MCLDHACTGLLLIYQTKTWPEHRASSNHKKKKKKDLPLLHKEKRIYNYIHKEDLQADLVP